MLLDSVSFITEFAFTEKPICFLTRNDKGDYRNFMNNAGLIVFDSIQKASSWEEAENFIDQIIDIMVKSKINPKRGVNGVKD